MKGFKETLKQNRSKEFKSQEKQSATTKFKYIFESLFFFYLSFSRRNKIDIHAIKKIEKYVGYSKILLNSLTNVRLSVLFLWKVLNSHDICCFQFWCITRKGFCLACKRTLADIWFSNFLPVAYRNKIELWKLIARDGVKENNVWNVVGHCQSQTLQWPGSVCTFDFYIYFGPISELSWFYICLRLIQAVGRLTQSTANFFLSIIRSIISALTDEFLTDDLEFSRFAF